MPVRKFQLGIMIGLLLMRCALAADSTDNDSMSGWWEDLAKDDPQASRALLKFADKPDDAIAFFKEHLAPLKISEEDVTKAIADLGSDDENVWKPAFEKLEYFDPRLTIDLSKLMSDVTEGSARTRLVEILSHRPADSLKGKTVALHNLGNGEGYNFCADNSSWWAEHQVSRIGNGPWQPKPKWTRATRAICLLEHIGGEKAVEIIKEMSTGHPEASTTHAAAEALDALGVTK